MKKLLILLVLSFGLFAEMYAAQAKPTAKKVVRKRAKIQYGSASYYSNAFNGKKTANGEIFSQSKLTAAHNNVPLGTWVRVTNLKNKKSVVVKITDRLHKRNHRLIDLSRAAARRIGLVQSGVSSVRIEVMGKTTPLANRP